ncbi:MAG: FAD-binding oxidoreductase, partial [Solirubrobacterales bacterium]|nr:FAD-binding oxidoreductase [Solirubrobacterales bacterium]
MNTDTLLADISALPQIGDDAVRLLGSQQIDEWPARLQGIAEPSSGTTVVVAPQNVEGVSAILRWAHERGARIQALGMGSNVVGAIDSSVDVLVSTARLDEIHDLDPIDQTVTVGAGIDGRTLDGHLCKEGFVLGHYPQSLHVSTVGGWIATRATGTYSAYYGGIERLLVGAEYVEPAGNIVCVAPRPRSSGGIDLLGLLCGSEGSLGIITQATLAVGRALPERRVCASMPDMRSGLDAQRQMVQSGVPLGLVRLYNPAESLVAAESGVLPESHCLLVATTMGPQAVADAGAAAITATIEAAGGELLAETAADPWFSRRYATPGFMADHNADDRRIFDTIEVALPWVTAAACAEELETALGPLSTPLHQHFSHVYPTGACLYAVLFISGDNQADAHARWATAWSRTLDIVARHRGTLAHHHGIGALRAR